MAVGWFGKELGRHLNTTEPEPDTGMAGLSCTCIVGSEWTINHTGGGTVHALAVSHVGRHPKSAPLTQWPLALTFDVPSFPRSQEGHHGVQPQDQRPTEDHCPRVL